MPLCKECLQYYSNPKNFPWTPGSIPWTHCHHETEVIDYESILKLPETMTMKRLDKIINSLYRIEVLLKNGNKTV